MRVSDERKQRYAKERDCMSVQKTTKKKQIINKKQKEIDYWDSRTQLISQTVATEIERRKINLDDKKSLEQVEEILKQCLELKIFKVRYQTDIDYNQILNAVKRYLNKTIKKEEGPSLDE